MTDKEYPDRPAMALLYKVIRDFCAIHPDDKWINTTADTPLPLPSLDQDIVAWQQPAKADPLSRCQKNLDDAKEIVLKSIELVLERGVKLEEALAATKDMSRQTQKFADAARRFNCCTLL
eukprot:TRINITY_DN4220_c0_g1_i1.p2 TRINITY_DN4220_c0_g1~~TRINITY_DN4220_c0_g1_i1.p2  ORF type:complete len:120 (+),score=22.84 TRINITY_DN4220_c0_g1_i1:350-709(+)